MTKQEMEDKLNARIKLLDDQIKHWLAEADKNNIGHDRYIKYASECIERYCEAIMIRQELFGY